MAPSTARYDPDGGDPPSVLSAKKPNLTKPLTLYRGTSVKTAKASGALKADGTLGTLQLWSGASADFSHGQNTALYWTPSRDLAITYAWQDAFFTKTDQIIFTATLNPTGSGVQLQVFDGPDLSVWRTAVTWGWTGSGSKPSTLSNHNVIAGWIQTKAGGQYWPSKSNLPQGSKNYDVYWQLALTTQSVVNGLTGVSFQNLGPAN
ncbi:hypothetical protein BDW22DRAFT_1432995 [Trametopsis cervina]|nr:hypothetical protein BDW22DRAFT_1432995 [Trametopsis cervina]